MSNPPPSFNVFLPHLLPITNEKKKEAKNVKQQQHAQSTTADPLGVQSTTADPLAAKTTQTPEVNSIVEQKNAAEAARKRRDDMKQAKLAASKRHDDMKQAKLDRIALILRGFFCLFFFRYILNGIFSANLYIPVFEKKKRSGR